MGGLCSKPAPSTTAAPNVVSVVDLTSNARSSAAATEEESVVSPLKLSFSPGAGIAEMTAEESVAARLEVRRDRRVSDIRTRSLSLPLASEEILLEELPPAKAATAPPKDDGDDEELVRTTTLKASFSSFRVRAVSILEETSAT